jgi:hypothetical protein
VGSKADPTVVGREGREPMGRSESSRVGRGVAVLVVAMLGAGAFAITPATAGKFLTKKRALKLFYAKSDADARFINVGEKAGDANLLDGLDSTDFLGAAGQATDADLLDGKDSTAFQQGCENGAVQAWADVVPPVEATYSNVASSFSCAGVQIRARQLQTGIYFVDFGGAEFAFPCQPRVTVVNLSNDLFAHAFAGTSTANDSGGVVPNCVARIDIVNEAGMHVDLERFTIVLFSPVPELVVP